MGSISEKRSQEGEGSVGLLQTLETSLDDIRTLITCRVCIRPLFEPYTMECGHTFCYGCLVRWFERDHTKKTCPDCRSEIPRAPAPAYLVRDMTQIFANRAELMPVGETTEDHKKWQEEEAALVEKDRSSTGPKSGLFRGCFRMRMLGGHRGMPYVFHQPIRDVEDGVDRCPRCTWELEDGLCQSCGYPSEDDPDELSDSDAPDYYHDEVYGDGHPMDDAILEALADGGHIHDLDGAYSIPSVSEDGYSSEFSGPFREPLPNLRDGMSFQRMARIGHRRPLSDVGTPYDSLQEETDEGSEDEEGLSLDDFVAEGSEDSLHSPSSVTRSIHWDSGEGSETENMQRQDSEDERGHVGNDNMNHNEVSTNSGPIARYNVEDDSDEGPIPPSRRQIARRRPIPDASSSDDVSHGRPRQQNDGREITNGTSQRQRNIPNRSDNAGTTGGLISGGPIELDSDSDAPVPASQSTRRRRRTLPRIAWGDDSGAEASSGTETVGRPSPKSTARQQNGRPEAHARNQSSPRAVQSGPTRSANQENRRPLPDSGVFSSYERGAEHLRATVPSITPWNRGNDSDLHQRAPAAVNHGVQSSPRTFHLHHSSYSSPFSRSGQDHSRLSPLPPRSHRHSPASGSSGRATTAEEEFQQGVRNRQAQKAERKAERRRVKADREQRRRNDATRSPSPIRRLTTAD